MDELSRYSFYLATGFHRRQEARDLAVDIRGKALHWTWSSTWLELGSENFPLDRAAQQDFSDLKKSDAIIVLHGVSTSGGMWCELGMGLALDKPILLLDSDVLPPPPLFVHFPHIIQWGEKTWDSDRIANWLLNIQIQRTRSKIESRR